jgi:dolichol-phosphate mannosyltransferase
MSTAPLRSGITIVVPTYQEVENIPLLVERIDKVRRENDLEIELLLMDDNSRDGSAELVERMNLPWVRLITRMGNRGLSNSVLDGLRIARHATLVVMDADLSHPPEKIPEMLARLNDGADFVIGSRFAKGGSTDTGWGLFRWLNSRIAGLFAIPLARVKDPMSGFFMIRKSTFANADALNPVGYKIGLELLVKCHCSRTDEVPIYFADRKHGKSKLSVTEQLRYLQHILRLYCYASRRWFKRIDYSPVAMLACVSLSALAAILFLPRQSIWIDETTQLSGLTLGPIGLIRWLAGQNHIFSVPPDRMPPMSYLVQWGWIQLFGSGVQTLRAFGIVCVSLAVAVTFAAARKAFGTLAAILAAMLLGLAPQVVTTAVEIRAYPLFLLEASLGFYFLIRYSSDGPERSGYWLAWMAVACIATMFTHLFGVIFTAGLLSAAFLISLQRFGELRRPAIATAIVAVFALGLIPFVRAAIAISGGETASLESAVSSRSIIRPLAQLTYHLFAHPATGLNAGAVVAAILGFSLLLLSLVVRFKSVALKERSLAVALGSGLAVAGLARIVVRGFEPLAPNYNIWILPGLYLLFAAGVTSTSRRARQLALVGAFLLIGANTYSDTQLALHGRAFAHGTESQLEDLVSRCGGPGKVAIVYENGSDLPPGYNAWPFVYYPLVYTYGRELPQYIAVARPIGSIVECNLPGPLRSPVDLGRPYLFVIRAEQEYTRQLASQVSNGMKPFGPGPFCLLMEKSPEWKHVGQECFLSLQASQVDIFRTTSVEPRLLKSLASDTSF